MKYFLTVFFVLASIIGYAQNGKIRGTVFDDATGESLVGATVIIKGTTEGTISDLDGNFTLEVAAGTYDMQITFISYQPLTVEGVDVKANDVTILNNFRLKENNLQLEEITVTAKTVRTSETALQTIKRKSAVIMDGISASKIKLIGDGNAVEAAKRVTGVSVEGGKYVYVRGLGDRYSKTTLNGMEIPGLDPDRNTLQMDIFPTNLIDNLLVSKNFTADMPADFTGGLLNIETKDFPEEKIISFSLSASYNPDMHFNSDYLTYSGSSTDWLGFDNGSRDIPAGANGEAIPGPVGSYSGAQISSFLNSFNSELGPVRESSFLDYSAGLSLGNQINLGSNNTDPKLGYIFSLSYKSSYDYFDDAAYGEYQRYLDPDSYEMRYATVKNGEIGKRNVLIGALGGLAYKTMYTKIRLTAMHLQNGESKSGILLVDNDGEAISQSGYTALTNTLEYTERGLTNVFLNGTHVLKKTGWEIDWRISPTYSTSNEPDIRKTTFSYNGDVNNTGDVFFSGGEGGLPSRVWRSLSELNVSSKLDLTKKYQLFAKDAKLKFGGSYSNKLRNYKILSVDMAFWGAQPNWQNFDANNVLVADNLYSNGGAIYYQSGNRTPNPNEYESAINNVGVYVSNEFSPFQNLKMILGVRAENFVQKHTGRDQLAATSNGADGNTLNDEKVLDALDFFPSINLIYALTEQQNLRAVYTKTIARPSFKELSFAQIIDPISDRTFNGGLYEYPGDWDGNLTETRVDNIDLRWELYLENGQMFSVSGFYKLFDKPIELVRIPTQPTTPEFQPRNVGDGKLYGVEIEFRKDLDFIADAFKQFNISGNFTYVVSEVEMTDLEFNTRDQYVKTGETIERTRQMAGQAPYVINAGLSYGNSEIGLNAGMFYNVKGATLYAIGTGLYPDVYTEPFHSLNFSLNKKIGKEQKTTIDFKVSNILNQEHKMVYKSYEAEDQIYEFWTPGRSFSLGISYSF